MQFELPNEIQTADTIEEAAKLLGVLLELEAPAPLTVTRRAIEDPSFARVLMATRKLRHVRDNLLSEQKPGSMKLVKKASNSILKWGMDGLKPARPWVIEKRLAACRACVHQVPAPNNLVYRGTKVVVGKDAKICEICECLTNTKAALSTERCPLQDPDNPSLSKWGEDWVPPNKHPKGPW